MMMIQAVTTSTTVGRSRSRASAERGHLPVGTGSARDVTVSTGGGRVRCSASDNYPSRVELLILRGGQHRWRVHHHHQHHHHCRPWCPQRRCRATPTATTTTTYHPTRQTKPTTKPTTPTTSKSSCTRRRSPRMGHRRPARHRPRPPRPRCCARRRSSRFNAPGVRTRWGAIAAEAAYARPRRRPTMTTRSARASSASRRCRLLPRHAVAGAEEVEGAGRRRQHRCCWCPISRCAWYATAP